MSWSFLDDEDVNYVMSGGEKVYIAANVQLVGGADTATNTLSSDFGGAYAAINGSLAGTYTVRLGADSTGSGAHVDIGLRGDIFGSSSGLILKGVSSELNNRGTIRGDGEAVLFQATSGEGYGSVRNTGEIIGGYVGMSCVSTQSVHIYNKGLIEGGTYSAATSEGGDQVTNAGEMVGGLFLNSGDDSYDGRKGTIDGLVEGGMGDDTLRGGDGDNSLDGGQDEDVLNGGAGLDILTGGSQADRFVFGALASSSADIANADHITDFNLSQGDIIDLDGIDANLARRGNQDFSFLGVKKFSGTSGELRYEASGTDIHVMGDVDGDGDADFLIVLDDLSSLSRKAFDF